MSARITAVRALTLSAASLLLLTGCWTSASETPAESPAAAPATSAPPSEPVETPTADCPAGSPDESRYECVGVTVTGAKDKEPTISLAEGFAPATELQVADVYEGSGDPVGPTDTLTVHYVGMGQQSREVFDSSWPSGQPATFALNQVIAGWQQGMVGMKPGGRRLLVIPGSLAYGPDGRPPVIGKDETLVFVVDLVSATAG